jgi:vancomycin resistance protein YoaR
VELAAYATSLRGRTRSQRHNALKAAAALNGAVIAPGATLSYNATVKSWSLDQGYVKAPVSYDGELVRAFGGGVCQTSTTLYNAALLAGLPIVERHPHVFAPHYVPPGQDAAVAQPNIDLRIRNPYPWPIRLQTSSDEDVLTIRILGACRPVGTVRIEQKVLASEMPAHLTRVLHLPEGRAGHAYVRNPGAVGYRVLTYRVFSEAGGVVRRECLGDDSYQAMDRIVQVAEEIGAE